MLPPIFGRRNRDSMERVRAQPFVREDLEREKRGQFHRYWWRWDAGARGYRHIGSEEEIRFRGEATPPIGASGEWRRFDYICAEATYPLLVEFTTWTPPEPTEAELEGTKRNYPTFNPINLEIYRMSRPSRIWLVDHRRSAELWRREQGEVASAPPYGLWRRADEAFHGAALAWPPLVVEGPACDMVAARGGWLNGDWREDVYRLIRRRWSDTARKDERIHFFPFGSDGSRLRAPSNSTRLPTTRPFRLMRRRSNGNSASEASASRSRNAGSKAGSYRQPTSLERAPHTSRANAGATSGQNGGRIGTRERTKRRRLSKA